MHTRSIAIRVNEQAKSVALGTSAFDLARALRPDADLLIYNGFPLSVDTKLTDGDELVLIRRGEVPSADDLQALLVARHGPGVHSQVCKARVGIAGCGGLGSTLAVALARTGVGTLVLADFDIVEPSNLNRQQFFVDQIGRYKVDALAETLARINPYVHLERRIQRLDRSNAAQVFQGCQVVAECFDNPSAKVQLAIAMRTQMPQVPLVTVSGIAGYGPASAIQSRRVLGNAFLIGDGCTAAAPGCGLLAPRVTVAAGHQASVVLRLLLGQLGPEDGG